MDQGPPEWNPPEILTPEWMKKVDKIYDTPKQRAARVHELIPEGVTQWDLLCFCIEYASGMAVAMFEDTDLYEGMKQAARWVYGMHYFQAPTIYASPDLKRVSKEKEDTDGVHPISRGDQPSLRDLQTGSDGAGE